MVLQTSDAAAHTDIQTQTDVDTHTHSVYVIYSIKICSVARNFESKT